MYREAQKCVIVGVGEYRKITRESDWTKPDLTESKEWC